MTILTTEQISKAVKLTYDMYIDVRTDETWIEEYKNSPESITVESIAENNLEYNMNWIKYEQEDLNEVIRLSKLFLDVA